MIQVTRASSESESMNVAVNIYDRFTYPELTYNPLLIATSQQTGKSINFVGFAANYEKKDRFVRFAITIVATSAEENKVQGKIHLGTSELPYGFYDVEIRENSSNSNLNTTGTFVVFNTLMNLTQNGNPAVTYTEYTDNDTDEEVVYITNDTI